MRGDDRLCTIFYHVPESTFKEAYDMVYDGFEFSEKLGEPVLMRMVTRLAHSRSGVERKEQKPQNLSLIHI